MKSSALAAVLQPFAGMANRHAISNIYKTLEFSPKTVRGIAPWGILEADCDIGVHDLFWIDSAKFIAVVASLPDSDVVLTVTGNALTWKCGQANGKLALNAPQEPLNPEWPNWDRMFKPDKEFVECLELAGLSTGPQSMASAGVHGLSFDRTPDGMMFSSTDSITMSLVRSPLFPDSPDRFALVPGAIDLLVTILKKKSELPARFGVADGVVLASAGPFRLLLRHAPLLKQDIVALASAYLAREVVATIPSDAVTAFVKRANALAESKQNTLLTLSVHSGTLALSFAEGAATSDEFYLIDSLDDVPADLPAIRLDATRLARVLVHTDKVALDHLERGVLVFFSLSPDFRYLISSAS